MKNKKLAYYLLPLVLFVWGMVTYKLVSVFNDASEAGSDREGQPVSLLPQAAPADTFQLILNYRDPFAAGRKTAKAPVVPAYRPVALSSPVNRPVATPVAAIEVQWPSVEYLGSIENRKAKAKVAMLKVGGQDYLLEEGKSVFGVKVMRIYGDSIKLEFENKSLFVKRGE